jgi:hypothetical protein
VTRVFELGDRSQPVPVLVEIDEHGQPVLRVKQGVPVTEGLLQVFNDLLADEDDVPGSRDAEEEATADR